MKLEDVKSGMMLRVVTDGNVWLSDRANGIVSHHAVKNGFIDLIVAVRKIPTGLDLKLTKGFMFVNQTRLDDEIVVFDSNNVSEHVARLGGLELLSEFIDLVLSS